MSADLSKIKQKAVSVSDAGRFTEMQMRRRNFLQNIKSVRIFIARCLRREGLLNGFAAVLCPVNGIVSRGNDENGSL